MDKPRVENKYNLTMKDCKKLIIKDRSKICEPIFWRNNVIGAWCISGNTARNHMDEEYGTFNEFWIGVYDEDAKAYANKVRIYFTAYGGMYSYNFNNFYDYEEIENYHDFKVQELFLEKINLLLDEGILGL